MYLLYILLEDCNVRVHVCVFVYSDFTFFLFLAIPDEL
jgi:hypothetical protein